MIAPWQNKSRAEAFKEYTAIAKRAEQGGDIHQAQAWRNARWRQCPNGPAEKKWSA